MGSRRRAAATMGTDRARSVFTASGAAGSWKTCETRLVPESK